MITAGPVGVGTAVGAAVIATVGLDAVLGVAGIIMGAVVSVGRLVAAGVHAANPRDTTTKRLRKDIFIDLFDLINIIILQGILVISVYCFA